MGLPEIQFDLFGTNFIVLFLILFPIIYLFIYRPYIDNGKSKDSPLFSVSVMHNMVLPSVCWVFLFAIPFIFLNSSPEISFGATSYFFLRFLLLFIYPLFVLLMAIDLFYWGWQYMSYLANLDAEDPRIKKVVRDLGLAKRHGR